MTRLIHTSPFQSWTTNLRLGPMNLVHASNYIEQRKTTLHRFDHVCRKAATVSNVNHEKGKQGKRRPSQTWIP